MYPVSLCPSSVTKQIFSEENIQWQFMFLRLHPHMNSQNLLAANSKPVIVRNYDIRLLHNYPHPQKNKINRK